MVSISHINFKSLAYRLAELIVKDIDCASESNNRLLSKNMELLTKTIQLFSELLDIVKK